MTRPRATSALVILALASFWVVLAAPRDARAAAQYVAAVRGKALVEGLGFEGVLTVFDETPRMYRTLGQPRTYAEYPLWYFYDSGTFKVTIQAEWRNERFLVKSIRYTGDPARSIASNQGIRLGDPIGRVVEANGEAELVRGSDFIYASRGVTYHIGTQSTVIGVTVYRPHFKPLAPEVSPPVAEPGQEPSPTSDPPAAPRVSGLDAFGVAVPLEGGWTPDGEVSSASGRFLGAAGKMVLAVRRCGECAADLGAMIREVEQRQSPNRVPQAHRDVPQERLQVYGADAAYLGRYDTQTGFLWLIGLRRGQAAWLLTLAVATGTLTQTDVAQLARALSGLRLLPVGR